MTRSSSEYPLGCKRRILEILSSRNRAGLITEVKASTGIIRQLTSFLFREDPLIVWRAMEAMGIAYRILAEEKMEKVRTGIRNLFWMMNDESGGLCRRSPEAIAEILINVPTLIGEYAHLLPSYLWEEPFERGIRFAIFRLAWKQPQSIDLFYSCLDQLEKSLQHDDEQIQGYGFLALHLIRTKKIVPSSPRLKFLPFPFPFTILRPGSWQPEVCLISVIKFLERRATEIVSRFSSESG